MSDLRIGPLAVDPPVVLAPMAGVTDVAFRRLCRRFGGGDLGGGDLGGGDLGGGDLGGGDLGPQAEQQRPVAGLYVSEMVGARALVEGDESSRLRAAFGDDEWPRSIQLYAVDPDEVADAVAWLVDAGRVDHIDLNFGCPAAKVTRHGGGAALPWRLDRYGAVVGATVDAAGPVPVTVKLRLGIDADHLTYLDAGRVAAEAGVAAVAVHARTAEQAYAGAADRGAIARLVEALPGVPVLGNGDIWAASDALDMMAATGCAGVVVGRGCLGRPWLFAELAAAFAGRPPPPPPRLGQVAAALAEHARLLAEHVGERNGLRRLRKHTAWYLHGFVVGSATRRALKQVSTIDELDALLGGLDGEQSLPVEQHRAPRGHTHGPQRVRLPDGWLASREQIAALHPDAALVASGG